jgi:hypothetical protein
MKTYLYKGNQSRVCYIDDPAHLAYCRIGYFCDAKISKIQHFGFIGQVKKLTNLYFQLFYIHTGRILTTMYYMYLENLQFTKLENLITCKIF